MNSSRQAENSKIDNPVQASQEVLNSETTEFEEDAEFWPLSGKPYASVLLAKSHLHPSYSVKMPAKLCHLLPSGIVPAVLTYRGKTWEMRYYGDGCSKRLDTKWKTFAIDNDLNIGDACVFELAECSPTKLKFKVQILRGDFPDELLAKNEIETPQLERVQHVENIPINIPHAQAVSSSEMKESNDIYDEEFWPLSGKPYFNLVLSKLNLKPTSQLRVPTRLYPLLPSVNCPVVLIYRGKKWEASYCGNERSCRRFDTRWKTYVKDNDLKDGDACVFGLTEQSETSLTFKVQILRGNFPSELLAKVDGLTPNNHITV